jgi:hypothetical protein
MHSSKLVWVFASVTVVGLTVFACSSSDSTPVLTENCAALQTCCDTYAADQEPDSCGEAYAGDDDDTCKGSLDQLMAQGQCAGKVKTGDGGDDDGGDDGGGFDAGTPPSFDSGSGDDAGTGDDAGGDDAGSDDAGSDDAGSGADAGSDAGSSVDAAKADTGA